MVIGIVIGLFVLVYLLYCLFRSPFSYPYFVYEFDVTGKRQPQIEDLIDGFIISDEGGSICNHYEYINQWKQECRDKIEKSLLKFLRKKQYYNCLDDDREFVFSMVRMRTHYRQKNYVRTPYMVAHYDKQYSFSYEKLYDRIQKLRSIGFECTLREYHSKDQRKLMTKQLRSEIMVRDNYTCRRCGKYMPDGVGLQIDHIIPIAKGGKTIPSNLQVLCSKCNGAKSSK